MAVRDDLYVLFVKEQVMCVYATGGNTSKQEGGMPRIDLWISSLRTDRRRGVGEGEVGSYVFLPLKLHKLSETEFLPTEEGGSPGNAPGEQPCLGAPGAVPVLTGQVGGLLRAQSPPRGHWLPEGHSAASLDGDRAGSQQGT